LNALLRAKAVAKWIDTSPQNIYTLARKGILKSVIFKASGNRFTYRFRPEDVEQFITGHLRDGQAEG
jgi:hypothetical protein